MGKRVRLTNETLNSYGTWLVTDGGDIEQYRRNPVLLWMHQRGQVIGLLKDIRVEKGEVTAEIEFDNATSLSEQCRKQWEFGSLNMVSVGIDILEMSDDKDLLKPGQTCKTVTKWKLCEVSLVDIGANDDALRLSLDGKVMTLGKDGENPLPSLITNNNTDKMEMKTLALMLGLPESATEAQIQAKIRELMTLSSEAESLRESNRKITLAAITAAVEDAVKEHRLTADKKEQFIKLGEKIGIDELRCTLDAMQPAVKPSAMLNHPGGAQVQYAKLSEVPSDKLLELRKDNPQEYRRLYRAEYGTDCTL